VPIAGDTAIEADANKLIQRQRDFQKVHDFLQRTQKSRPFWKPLMRALASKRN